MCAPNQSVLLCGLSSATEREFSRRLRRRTALVRGLGPLTSSIRVRSRDSRTCARLLNPILIPPKKWKAYEPRKTLLEEHLQRRDLV